MVKNRFLFIGVSVLLAGVLGLQASELHQAAVRGDLASVEQLLVHNDINAQDEQGNTPLYKAVENQDVRLVEFLLQHGADVRIRNKHGLQPLHVAMREARWYEKEENAQIAKLLRNYDMSDLRKAVDQGDLAAIETFLIQKVDVNARDSYGKTALYWAVAGRSCWYEGEEKVEISDACRIAMVKTLIDHGADVNICCQEEIESSGKPLRIERGDSPLHEAVRKQSFQLVELLLKSGAHVNMTDNFDETPLHVAARAGWGDVEGDVEIAKLLIKYGANINAFDHNKQTPLAEAFLYGNTGIAKLLMAQGAQLGRSDCTLLELAFTSLMMGRGLASAITHNGAYWTKLNDREKRFFEFCVHASSNLKVESDGKEYLPYCIMLGDSGLVQLLLDKGLDVNACGKNFGTALHCAAKLDASEMIKLLVQNGANVNAKNKKGNTPLHDAVYEGKVEAAKLLLHLRADINARNQKGETPLHIVNPRESVSCDDEDSYEDDDWSRPPLDEEERAMFTRLLLDHGADASIKDNRGRIAYKVSRGPGQRRRR